MTRFSARCLAFVLILVLLLAPGVGRAWPLGPEGPAAAGQAGEFSLSSWIPSLVSFLWDSFTGDDSPGANGTTTDLGPTMDPDGATTEWGPTMDPNG